MVYFTHPTNVFRQVQTTMIIFYQRFHPAGDAGRVMTIKNQIKNNQMKHLFLLLSFIFVFTTIISAQNALYQKYAKEADSLYDAKDYLKSAQKFSEAFKSNNWKGTSSDRYNAACSWALAGVPDSAFFQLDRIATKANYTNLGHISNDTDLNSLHDDKRWQPLLAIIKGNKEKEEANLDKSLVAILDTVYIEDQKYRQQ